MKKISELMYVTKFPFSNFNYFKDLEDKELYLNECSTYYDLLLKYLINNTSIKKFEEEISNCKDYMFDITGVSKESMDLYQYISSDRLSFFYIRNNVFVEKLDENEKKYLDSLIDKDEYNEEIESFIKKTYKKVIKEERDDSKESYYINFGPSTNERFLALNDSLIIGARMNEYVSSLKTEEEKDNYFKRINYFDNKCNELKECLKKELNEEVSVIKYDDYSVKKIVFESEKTLK